MDITQISYEQALVDLDLANARVVDLSCRIEVASSELLHLREEFEQLNMVASAIEQPAAVEKIRLSIGLMRNLQRKKVMCHIDEVCGMRLTSQNPDGKHKISRRDTPSLTISGWVVPKNFRGFLPVVDVVFKNDAKSFSMRTTTFSRKDVAAHFRNPEVELSGFRVKMPTAEINPGTYTVELRGDAPNGDIVSVKAVVLDIQ